MVPTSATNRLAFVFHDGAGLWHNNYTNDWQALLDRVSILSSPSSSNATIRYEADMGPLAAAADVQAWISYNGGLYPATGAVTMFNVSRSRWEYPVAVPDYSKTLTVHFSGNGQWDDNAKRGWTFPVSRLWPPPFSTNQVWPPAPIVALGTPVITGNPTGAPPDNVGDNFDLVMQGPPLQDGDRPRGFGDFGSVWVNVDATNLYLGGYGLDLGGTNNVVLLFLGLDTLSDNAWNLWHKSGLPNALDFLHNVRFTEPMDLAIVLGDQFADGPAYTNFTYGGYDFGQGIYYVGTNWPGFVPVDTARLSQFHGAETVPTATPGDVAQRQTTRWEVALPWSALDAAGPESVSNLFIGGVIASDSVVANDRYLSRTYLGERAWGQVDGYGQFAYATVGLRPVRLNFLHADLRGDGISNGWRQVYFGSPDGPPANWDSDGDGQDNGEEEIAGTHPLDPQAYFALEGDGPEMSWPFVPGRAYDVDFTPDMRQPFAPLATGLATNAYAPDSNGFYRVRVRK